MCGAAKAKGQHTSCGTDGCRESHATPAKARGHIITTKEDTSPGHPKLNSDEGGDSGLAGRCCNGFATLRIVSQEDTLRDWPGARSICCQ